MPIRLNTLSPALNRQPPAGQPGAGADPTLVQQLNRARQTLARGDLSPADVAKLRSLLTLAGRALSRGDDMNAQRYADEAERTSGSDPGAPANNSDEDGGGDNAGRTENPGRAPEAPTADDTQRLGKGERRTYQDVSGDPGVSFKQPTKLTSGQAEVLVRFHERQHLRRDTEEAAAHGRKVVYAYTAIQYRTDPSSGNRYIKGGKTVIKTAPDRTPQIDAKA